MKTEILTKDGLNIYDELIKNYILNNKGLTEEEIQNMIETTSTGIKLSESATYEPLE